MTARLLRPTLTVGIVALAAPLGLWAQSSTTSRPAGTASTPAATSAAARANAAGSGGAARTSSAASARKVIPDPALFDGKGLPAEQRPDRGMLAEFELPGSEERPESMESAGSAQSQGAQPGGGSSESGQNQGQGRGQNGPQGQGAGGEPIQGAGNEAQADGVAVGRLETSENSAAQAAMPPKPREVSIGDRSMQIPTAVAQQNVIGQQAQPAAGGQRGATNTQGYEKGAAAGASAGNNQNKGLEKGRVIPEGL